MRADRCLLFGLLLALTGCGGNGDPELLGTLEWDRVGIPAESSETILRWDVAEGDKVKAGQLLLELDPRRLDAQVAQARGQVAQAQARFDEMSNGARSEEIDAARATLARARAAQTDAERNFPRIEQMYKRGMVAIAELDRVRATRDQARNESRNAEARLRELTNGTRPEQIEQARAALEAAQGNLAHLEVTRQHLSVRAPRDGVVDSLPFKPGDQPPEGAEVVSMLVGDVPYARLFIPASIRAQVEVGSRVRIHVEGVEQPFEAKLRSIRSESSFTPYFALTGDDASRLVYRAEAVLEGEGARRLPAGLPLSAERIDDERQ